MYRGLIVYLYLGGWFCLSLAEETVSVPVEAAEIIDQFIYQESKVACGPCSMFHAAKFGDDELKAHFKDRVLGRDDSMKVKFLVDRYFRNRGSVVNKGRSRFGVHGVMTADLKNACNEFLKEGELDEIDSASLDREFGESDLDHLKRVHEMMSDSLKRGFPPILSIRSFVVKHREEKKMKPAWELGHSHYVVVSSVPSQLKRDAQGFLATVIDSNGGKISSLWIHSEPNGQAFSALKGDNSEGPWLSGRPFLLINSKEMRAVRPRTLKWSDRYIVVANLLIGRF